MSSRNSKDMLSKLQARRAAQASGENTEMGERHGMSDAQREIMELMTNQKFTRPSPQVVEKIVEVVPKGALVQNEDGTLGLGGFLLTGTGLLVNDDASFDDWKMVGGVLRRIESGLQWMLGDWLAFGERTYGETYQQVAESMGYEAKTLYNFAYVCKGVDFSLRKEKLSFGHHNLVAAMPPEEQDYWLTEAIAGRWSVAKLRRAIRGELPQAEQPAMLDQGEPIEWQAEQEEHPLFTRDPEQYVQLPLFEDENYARALARFSSVARRGIPRDARFRRQLRSDLERVLEAAQEALRALDEE